MNDTPSSVSEEYRRRLMEKSGEERLLMGVSMHETARTMVLASLPKESTPAEIRKFLFLRFYPELVMQK